MKKHIDWGRVGILGLIMVAIPIISVIGCLITRQEIEAVTAWYICYLFVGAASLFVALGFIVAVGGIIRFLVNWIYHNGEGKKESDVQNDN